MGAPRAIRGDALEKLIGQEEGEEVTKQDK
jgi:hypothetical protein